jgi:hypothetical protein
VLEEERAGLFDGARRFTLAARHLAARAAHDGAPPCEVASRLVRAGVTAERAARVLVRVYRAGGLGREAIYLPAYLRVRKALDEAPELATQPATGPRLGGRGPSARGVTRRRGARARAPPRHGPRGDACLATRARAKP